MKSFAILLVVLCSLGWSQSTYSNTAAYCLKLKGKDLCTFDEAGSCVKTARATGGECVVNKSSAPAVKSQSSNYTIEKSINDEKFIINGELFSAQTYCFGFLDGDQVRFIEGSAFGACVTAKIINLRSGDICEAWCE